MSSRRAGGLASDPRAHEVVETALLDGKDALSAALRGYFAAAGSSPGVLLAPLTILLGGVGIGQRAFDGRCKQPGQGARRPRGFLPQDTIPVAARAAVPTGVEAIAVALAGQATSLPSVVVPGINAAKKAGASGRAHVLEQVRSMGAGALREAGLARAFQHVAGPSAGGMFTPEDFAASPDVEQPAIERQVQGASWSEAPWAQPEKATLKDLGRSHIILAIDVHGLMVGLSYHDLADGLEVEGAELRLATLGQPVLRGVPRLRPGTRLPSPAPLALRSTDEGAELSGAREVSESAAPSAYRLVRRSDRTVAVG